MWPKPEENALSMARAEKKKFASMLIRLCERITTHQHITTFITPDKELEAWWNEYLDAEAMVKALRERNEATRKKTERERLKMEQKELESKLARVKELLSNE